MLITVDLEESIIHQRTRIDESSEADCRKWRPRAGTERRRELALCPEEAHRAYVGPTSTNRAIKLKMLLVMDI